LTTEATSIATDASNAATSGIPMSVFDIVHADTNLVDFNKWRNAQDTRPSV
jgi:hypothetical protein